MENQDEVTRKLAKYIFIDVVQFSKRSAEAQSDIVKSFNTIVHQVLEEHKANKDNDNECILIPTGDGMCISLLSQDLAFDSHIQIALSILKSIDEYNKATESEARQYQVRIGINQNTDILVTDINGRKNVAGAGINMASRVMDKADGGQILVSQAVHHELQPSEIYMDKFKRFSATGKHNIHFEVHQYILPEKIGLNVDIPESFKPVDLPVKAKDKLPKRIAYHMACLIRERKFLIEKNKDNDYVDLYYLKSILWLISHDLKSGSEATEYRTAHFFSHEFGKVTIDVQLVFYKEIEFGLFLAFNEEIDNLLEPYSEYFDDPQLKLFVNDEGKEKLKSDWIEIWQELELDNYV